MAALISSDATPPRATAARRRWRDSRECDMVVHATLRVQLHSRRCLRQVKRSRPGRASLHRTIRAHGDDPRSARDAMLLDFRVIMLSDANAAASLAEPVA